MGAITSVELGLQAPFFDGGAETLPRERLAQVQAERLRATVANAFDNVPLHRARLGKLVQRQVTPMRTTVTPANYRREVAAALARRLVRELATNAASTSTQ